MARRLGQGLLAGSDAEPGIELVEREGQPWPLTLRDMFGATVVVQATNGTTVREAKELVRIAKSESAEYLDAAVLLYNQQPLADDTTVGSHGLTRETTVTLSTQDPTRGRARREIRETEAALEADAALARAQRVATRKKLAAASLLLLAVALLQLYWTTAASKCAEGMGSHGVVRFGAAYRTLDGASPDGGCCGAPGFGCQCHDADGDGLRNDDCPSNWMALPPGWELAPNDADTIAVIAAHGWSTNCVVAADGSAWASANGRHAGDACEFDSTSDSGSFLSKCERGSDESRAACPKVSSGTTYTVSWCNLRVLLRCS